MMMYFIRRTYSSTTRYYILPPSAWQQTFFFTSHADHHLVLASAYTTWTTHHFLVHVKAVGGVPYFSLLVIIDDPTHANHLPSSSLHSRQCHLATEEIKKTANAPYDVLSRLPLTHPRHGHLGRRTYHPIPPPFQLRPEEVGREVVYSALALLRDAEIHKLAYLQIQ